MIAFPLLASAVVLQVAASGLDHRALGCAVADRFVRLEARARSSGLVGSARVYFRAPGHGEWYWVSMSPEGDGLRGVLPKPTRKLTAFDYYIEVVDLHLQAARTPDVTVRVESGCDEMGSSLAGVTAPIVVGVGSAGLPVVPLGFSSAGVVAAGATAGTTAAAGGATATDADGGSTAAVGGAVPKSRGGGATTALVAGGVVAGGLAVAAIAAGGSDAATSQPTPAASGCPPPAGSGPVRSQAFAWTLPGGSAFLAQRFELPFLVTGGGVVEARTSYSSNSRVCTCLGTGSVCRPVCAGESITLSAQVCEVAEFTPGQWWFQIYCQTQDAGVCITPLPAGGLSGTTTVTYTPR